LVFKPGAANTRVYTVGVIDYLGPESPLTVLCIHKKGAESVAPLKCGPVIYFIVRFTALECVVLKNPFYRKSSYFLKQFCI